MYLVKILYTGMMILDVDNNNPHNLSISIPIDADGSHKACVVWDLEALAANQAPTKKRKPANLCGSADQEGFSSTLTANTQLALVHSGALRTPTQAGGARPASRLPDASNNGLFSWVMERDEYALGNGLRNFPKATMHVENARRENCLFIADGTRIHKFRLHKNNATVGRPSAYSEVVSATVLAEGDPDDFYLTIGNVRKRPRRQTCQEGAMQLPCFYIVVSNMPDLSNASVNRSRHQHFHRLQELVAQPNGNIDTMERMPESVPDSLQPRCQEIPSVTFSASGNVVSPSLIEILSVGNRPICPPSG